MVPSGGIQQVLSQVLQQGLRVPSGGIQQILSQVLQQGLRGVAVALVRAARKEMLDVAPAHLAISQPGPFLVRDPLGRRSGGSTYTSSRIVTGTRIRSVESVPSAGTLWGILLLLARPCMAAGPLAPTCEA